jgi:Holliday junction resolvase RusA-like endonuclease
VPRRAARPTTGQEAQNSALEALRATEGAHAPWDAPIRHIRHTVILENFPSPDAMRALSPNGRGHWGGRARVMARVMDEVAWRVRLHQLAPLAGPVRLHFRYVFPVRRKRDVDNLTTGVTKAVIDTLVRGGWLEADDSEHVIEVTAEPVVERGHRRLEITIDPAPITAAGREG